MSQFCTCHGMCKLRPDMTIIFDVRLTYLNNSIIADNDFVTWFLSPIYAQDWPLEGGL